jgi:hypothetical protein
LGSTATCALPVAAGADEVAAHAAGADAAAKVALTQRLEHLLPGHWQIHVRWRDVALLASFMPPYQDAFDLWYRPDDLLAWMKGLCPVAADPIWRMLAPDQDIVMEPTVGGKTAAKMRVSCRNVARTPS